MPLLSKCPWCRGRRLPAISQDLGARYQLKNQITQNLSVAETQIEALLQELDQLVSDYVVYVPLAGVSLAQLTPKELDLGDYKIYQFGEGPLQEAQGSLAELYEHAGSSYVAKGGVRGDIHFAIEQAYQLTESVVHILNLYAMSIEARLSRRWKIELAVTQSYKSELVILQPVAQNDEKPSLNQLGYSHSLKDFSPIPITVDLVEAWRQDGFDQVVECFENAQGKIQERIKRSVIWYSRGMNADDPNEQFVNFAIALESLLVGDGGSIRQKLADRVAFLLAEEYEDRIEVSKKTKKLYDLRSKVVHTGTSVTEHDLIDLCHITNRSIVSFATRDFASWEEFIEWISRLTYSSGTLSTTSS